MQRSRNEAYQLVQIFDIFPYSLLTSSAARLYCRLSYTVRVAPASSICEAGPSFSSRLGSIFPVRQNRRVRTTAFSRQANDILARKVEVKIGGF